MERLQVEKNLQTSLNNFSIPMIYPKNLEYHLPLVVTITNLYEALVYLCICKLTSIFHTVFIQQYTVVQAMLFTGNSVLKE